MSTKNDERYYDVVASICSETDRTDSHLICGGFKSSEDALKYINAHKISEQDYYQYCKDDETAYIEIEEHYGGCIVDVITVD